MKLSFVPEQIELLPLSAVAAYPKNPRKHPPEQIEKIAASMRTFGWTMPILVDAKNEIIAGHGRLLAAERVGLKQIPAIRIEHLSPTEIRACRLADNQLTIAGEWDNELLSFEIHDLNSDGFDLDILGFDTPELDGLLSPLDDDKDLDEAPEPPVTPVSRLGDLWLMGKHRLLCGDCTNTGSVSLLMCGQKACYTFTSPPYGISLEYEKASSFDDLCALINSSIGTIDVISTDDAYATINYADIFIPGSAGFTPMTQYYHAAFTAVRWHLRGNRIWAKPFGRLSLAYGISTTMNLREWEYVQTYRKGRGQETLRNQGITLRGIWKSFGDDAIIKDWKSHDSTTSKDVHPASFPVLLPIAGLRAYTDIGDTIFEPFCGSGTTLIASETSGRICYGMEIAPRYIDVAVIRWQNLTGEKATLDGDGRTFDEISAARLCQTED